jgi:hypothetical protein
MGRLETFGVPAHSLEEACHLSTLSLFRSALRLGNVPQGSEIFDVLSTDLVALRLLLRRGLWEGARVPSCWSSSVVLDAAQDFLSR